MKLKAFESKDFKNGKKEVLGLLKFFQYGLQRPSLGPSRITTGPLLPGDVKTGVCTPLRMVLVTQDFRGWTTSNLVLKILCPEGQSCSDSHEDGASIFAFQIGIFVTVMAMTRTRMTKHFYHIITAT